MIGTFLHDHAAALIWTAMVLLVMLLFKPTRSLLASLLGLLFKGIVAVAHFVGNHAQSILAAVMRAHGTLLLNLLPRTAALPSVANPKTTRKA